MSATLLDTQAAVDRLTASGIDPEQARAHVKLLRDALEGGVATKQDLDALRTATTQDFQELRHEMISRMDAIEARMDIVDTRMGAIEGRMEAIEARMDRLETRMAGLEKRFDALQWKMIGAVFAAVGLFFTLQRAFPAG